MSQPVKPAALPVTRGDGEQQVQVFWGAGQQETLLQRQRQLLGEALSHEPLTTTESPSRMNRTASAAVTTLSLTSVPPERDSEGSTTLAVLATYP